MNRIALFEQPLQATPIVELSGAYSENRIFVKREDLIPFSFGGNKARKAAAFYRDLIGTGTDLLMTYGSASSNHCRIIANMAFALGIRCHIISPDSSGHTLSFNRFLAERFSASVEVCPLSEVGATIEKRIESFRAKGYMPYFVMGGGHGNLGTGAYVDAYEEICRQQRELQTRFDSIWFASGTGSTQAGLVVGRLRALAEGKAAPKVCGISIAREENCGKDVIRQSILDYLGEESALFREEELLFTDQYRLGGYGHYDEEITQVIAKVMSHDGLPMDTTYVGKAFCGMLKELRERKISGKNILFLHTGGTPLYFDYLRGQQ